ncbi:uncharacterized protein LOC129766900 [Toxorhynchites rutilus septentrionalis]|uniref:uncharacterized protein LOC129766900 n=1 Tax=Toxorhynchites rutilus septentrionalis TaxID=329112 RepID=UPI00247B06FF|nr:uncharacterized protein LOC129766900 [Toxorhynchites rutilus septentrionalis]
MRHCGWWLALTVAFGMTALVKGEADLVYYPEIDIQNILSPMNLCEELCGQCGCIGTFLADDMCQCSCQARDCIPEYTNCTDRMMRICDESETDCELIEEPEFGIRTREPRKHCMECHEDHDSEEYGGYDGYDDYGANGYGDNGYGEGHGNCGDKGKKFLCCKKKKHKKKKCKKHKHHKKIHIKIKGKLPDCCYFNNFNNHHDYDDYRTPQRKRILEEPTTIHPPTDNFHDVAPEEPVPIVEPEIETTTQARAYVEPEPRYVDEEPKKCCNPNSNIHCDNCHIYSDCKEESKYGPSNEYRTADDAPREEEPPQPSKFNLKPIKVPDFRDENPRGNNGPSWSNSNREPERVPSPTWSHSNREPERVPSPTWSHSDREPAMAPSSRFDNADGANFKPRFPGMEGCDNCEVLEFSHHKVKVPTTHFKPIIERFLDHQSTDSQPINLNAYNRAVNWHIFEDQRARKYQTDSFQPTKVPCRDKYQVSTHDTAASMFAPCSSCGNVQYMPIVAPPATYAAPVSAYAPSHRAGPDTGPVVFETVEEDIQPPAPKPLPHYLQTQKASYDEPICATPVRPMMKPVSAEIHC